MKMENQIQMIDVEKIIPNRFQPRLQFDDTALNDLASSIQEHGIVEPLIVRRVLDKFEIIAGERRFKASQIVGLKAVPCIIANLDDNESAEVAIIENTQRKNLSAIEEARSYKKLLDRRYVTQDQLAKRLGTSQSTIANKIRLLNLDEQVQDALMKEKISERHARSLLKVTDKVKQVQLLNQIIEERWTVKRLEEEIENVTESYRRKEIVGGINTNNRMDIDIDSIMKNSTDIQNTVAPTVHYKNEEPTSAPKKNSLFFNNLENEAVNMDPTLSFGFNPFKTANLNQNFISDDDDDYDTLETEEETEKVEKVEEKQEKIVELELEKNKDVVEQIKKTLSKAKVNGLNVESEEFSFDDMTQFVIRIKNDD